MATDLKRDIRFKTSLPAIFIIAIAAGAISLFLQLSPAIETIIERNVVSLEAVEEMLSALVIAEGNKGDVQSTQFEFAEKKFFAALEQARKHMVEQEEFRLVPNITLKARKYFDGEDSELKPLLTEINALSATNRQGMVSSDLNAKQLGRAGAWTMMLLGFCGFVVSLYVSHRLVHSLIYPIEEIYSVTESHLQGDTNRRAYDFSLAPQQLRAISHFLNSNLDRQLAALNQPNPTGAINYKNLLHQLIEFFEDPIVLLSKDGDILGGNNEAIDRLANVSAKSIREELLHGTPGSQDSIISEVRQIDDSYLLVLR